MKPQLDWSSAAAACLGSEVSLCESQWKEKKKRKQGKSISRIIEEHLTISHEPADVVFLRSYSWWLPAGNSDVFRFTSVPLWPNIQVFTLFLCTVKNPLCFRNICNSGNLAHCGCVECSEEDVQLVAHTSLSLPLLLRLFLLAQEHWTWHNPARINWKHVTADSWKH